MKLLDIATAKDARVKCLEIGGDLVLPTNNQQNQDLIRAIKNLGNRSNVHIRTSDILMEGQWLDMATGKPISYANWGPSSPDNWQKSEHYALIDAFGNWNDVKWDVLGYPLCQKTDKPGNKNSYEF